MATNDWDRVEDAIKTAVEQELTLSETMQRLNEVIRPERGRKWDFVPNYIFATLATMAEKHEAENS